MNKTWDMICLIALAILVWMYFWGTTYLGKYGKYVACVALGAQVLDLLLNKGM